MEQLEDGPSVTTHRINQGCEEHRAGASILASIPDIELNHRGTVAHRLDAFLLRLRFSRVGRVQTDLESFAFLGSYLRF
jgi:hypothetical protein